MYPDDRLLALDTVDRSERLRAAWAGRRSVGRTTTAARSYPGQTLVGGGAAGAVRDRVVRSARRRWSLPGSGAWPAVR